VALVTTAISAYIRENALGPGDILPSEDSLSKELGVSRTVVREGLRSLAAMRLIDVNVGRRARVASLDLNAMSAITVQGYETGQISVQQIYDVRRTIEMRTVALAALRRKAAEATLIVGYARAMLDHIERPDVVMDNDILFHEAIAEASQNPVFRLIVGAFRGVTQQTWGVSWRSRASDDLRLQSVMNHNAIAAAIREGDPKCASDLMAAHFDNSVAALIAAGLG